MLQFITKDEYFAWIDAFQSERDAYASATPNNLKDIQDHYILSKLSAMKGGRVLEVGGGDCRVLRGFTNTLECWNAEKFTGAGIGPKSEIRYPGLRNALTHLGEFSDELPDNYFDLVFSISVVEHIEDDQLKDFFRDIARVLKPGGRSVHAIDLYVFDHDQTELSAAKYAARRLQHYLDVPAICDRTVEFVEPPKATTAPVFSCSYATNSDREMLAWNKYAPSLKEIRSIAQSVSLAAEWVKGQPFGKTSVG